MGLLKNAYTYLAKKVEDFSGKTKEKYIQEFVVCPQTSTKDEYFGKGLNVAVAFRSAKKYGKREYMQAALSKFEALESEFSNKKDSGALATGIWTNVEAYQATGDGKYARAAKKGADVLVKERMDGFRFVKSWTGDEPELRAEDQLLAASALLQLYELYPKAERYREKAEGILNFFAEEHAKEGGKIVEKLKATVKRNLTTVYEPNGKDERQAYLKNLAAVAYLNAQRITGKYEQEAKKFFELSDKSLLIYSEASRAFDGKKEYSKRYGELRKREMEGPTFSSVENAAGMMGTPAFDVEPEDPKLFREMLAVGAALAFGGGLVWAIMPFLPAIGALGAAEAAKAYALSATINCVANAAALPFAGRAADKYGKKKVLGIGVPLYAASIAATPWLIENYAALGLQVASVVRGASGALPGPALSSLVTEALPPSKRAQALSDSQMAYTVGYGGGSFFGGLAYNAASNFGKYAPFAAAAALPALAIVRPLRNHRKARQRRKTLEAVFGENPEAAPAIATGKTCKL